MMTEQEKLILKLKEAHEKREKANEEASLDFGKDYNKAEHSKNSALSDKLYDKNAHFIYELIQNAEDSKYTKNINSELKFNLLSEGIVILSNQDGFTDDDIRSICVMASGEKIANKDQFIGEKGLGFRSVFKITDKPCISSNGYKFFFDKEKSYEKPFLLKDFDKKLPEIFINYENTAIYLPYSLNFDKRKELENDFKDKVKSKIILFLKKLNSIIIFKNNEKILDISKTKTNNENFEKYELSDNKNYLIVRKDVDVSKIMEERRKNIKKREVILAFPENFIENEINIFAFLPTDINSRFGFTIQADFLLDTQRGGIDENFWNQNLFNEIKIFIIEIIDKFKQHSKLKFQFLKYYIQQAKSDNKYIDTMYENILSNISKKELILTSNDNWQIPQNIILLEEIEIESKYLKILFGNNYELKHKDFILDDFFINRFKIRKVDRKEIINEICKYFDSKDFNILTNQEILYFTKLLAKYLSVDSRASSYDKNQFEKVKKSLPIIPKYSNEKKYYLYDSIYISSEYKPDLIIENFVDESEFDFSNYNFLSNDYLDKDNKSLENFIRKIIGEQKEDKNRKTIEFFEKNTKILQKFLLKDLEHNYKKILDFLIENQENNIEKISSIKLVYSNNETWLNGKESIYFSSDDNSFVTLNNKLFSLIKNNSNFKDFFIKVFKVKEADTITLILNEDLPWLENNINKRNSENDDKLLKITKQIIINFDKFEKEDIDRIKSKLFFISINQINKYLKAHYTYLTQLISEEIYSSNSINKYLQNRELFDFLDERYEEIFEEIKNKENFKSFFKKFNFERNLKEEDISKFIKSINNDLDLNSSVEVLKLICDSIDESDKKKIEEIKNLQIFSNKNEKMKISSLFFEKVWDLSVSFMHNDYKKLKKLNILRQYFASENDINPFIKYLKEIDNFNEVIEIYKYLDFKSPETTLQEHNKTHTITIDKIRNSFMKEELIFDKELKKYSVNNVVWSANADKNILVLSEIYTSELQNFFLKKIKISQEKNIKQILDEIKLIKNKTKNYFELLIDLGNLIGENSELEKYKKSYNGMIDNRFDNNIYENAKQFILKEERIFILENDEKCKDDNFYFNDLNVDEIPEKLESKIFSIDNKIFPINHFDKLIDTLKIKRLSQIQKEFSNREFMEDFPLKEYREILHFSYDLLFTKDFDKYNELKNRKTELEEINSIEKISVHKDIICQIKINEETIKVDESKYYFKNNILYIVNQKDIFKIISSKIKDINDKEIKDFYNDVISGEISKNEYYQRENIKNKKDFVLEIPEYIENEVNKNREDSLNYEEDIVDSNPNNTFYKINKKTAEQEREERKKSGLEQVKNHENSITLEYSKDLNIDNFLDIAKYKEDIQNRRKKNISEIKNSESLSTISKQEIPQNKKFGADEIRNEFKSEKYYRGQCQICGFTFPTNDGNYCERFTWTDFKKGRWTDFQKKQAENRLITKGNSLCLCAKCHSIIKNGGHFEATFLNHEVEEKLKNENYNFDEFLKDINVDKLFQKPECFEIYVEFGDMFVLEIRLNKKIEYIYMTEVHLVEFFEFLKN